MRTTKAVALLLAVLLAVVSPLTALAGPADAATRPFKLTAHGKKVESSRKFAAYGTVRGYRKQTVRLVKARSRRADFHAFLETKTNRRGHFNIRFAGPVGSCYRIVVPGRPGRRTTTAFIGCIV